MSLRLNLIIPNKAVHALIAIVVVSVFVAYVYAQYTFPPAFLGHGGTEVWINTLAGETTLQAAIDSGMFGDITAVFSGVGTKGLALSGPVTIEFDCSEVSGNGITCSGEDLQVNTGTTSTTGLEIVSDQVRLMNDGCAAGEILKRNAANTGWECVADDTGGGALPACADEQILKYNFGLSTWECADEAAGGGGLAFGDWDQTDSGQIGGAGANLARDTTYQAATDGFVTAAGLTPASGPMYIRTDSNPNPSTIRCKQTGYHTVDGSKSTSCFVSVKKGDYWRVTHNAAATIYWLPVVSGGGGGQSVQVVGNTNVSTNSASWVDMPGMSYTITTTGGNLLVMFSARMRAQEDWGGYTRLLIDDIEKHRIGWEVGNNAGMHSTAMQWLETGLSAGSHTFKIQWSSIGVTIYQDGATYPRVLTALEV